MFVVSERKWPVPAQSCQHPQRSPVAERGRAARSVETRPRAPGGSGLRNSCLPSARVPGTDVTKLVGNSQGS